MPAHEDQVRVAAGSDQAEQGEAGLDLGVGFFKPGGIDVPLQVIDADQRQSLSQRQPLRSVDAHQQGPGEPGPVGDCDAVQLAKPHSSIVKGLAHDGHQRHKVLPRRNFWDDAAELGVKGRLGGHDVGDDAAAVLHHGGGCLVTRCLNAEYLHGYVPS